MSLLIADFETITTAELKIKTNYLLKNVQTIITDERGRIVFFAKRQDIVVTEDIYLSLNNRVYTMTIKVDKDIITKKILVNE